MSIASKTLDIFMVYKFIRSLSTDWKDMEAYKLGIIDEDGNILKKRSSLSGDEKDAYSLFDRLVWKIKRVIEMVPFGRNKIARYASALWFLKESKQYEEALKTFLIENSLALPDDFRSPLTESFEPLVGSQYVLLNSVKNLEEDTVFQRGERVRIVETFSFLGQRICEVENARKVRFPVALEDLMEDAPTNSIGGGGIATYEKPLSKSKSCRTDDFMNSAVFEVGPENYSKCVHGKNRFHRYDRYVGNDDVGEEIRLFGRENPNESIIIKNARTGEMSFLRRKP